MTMLRQSVVEVISHQAMRAREAATSAHDSPVAYPSTTRACILGADLQNGNRGVLALGVSILQLLRRTCPVAVAVFHYPHVTGGVRRIAGDEQDMFVEVQNCRLSPRSRPSRHLAVILVLAVLHRCGIRAPARRNAWLRSLLEADFIGDIRGGDSFSDIYGVRRFLEGSLPLLSVVLLQKPFTLLPQTYGPFDSPVSRALARFLLRRASTIFTRDRNCETTVRRLSGRSPEYCPDVAFTLEAHEARDVQLSSVGLRLGCEDLLVGINVSGLLYTGGYTGHNMFALHSAYPQLMEDLMERLLSSTSAKVLLIPHVVGEQEEEACLSVLRSAACRYPGRVFALTQALSERQLKWVIGKTDFFIGARMHACIAALSQCVPTVGLAYSDKFLGVFQSAGVGEAAIDLRTVEHAAVIEQAFSALTHRHDIAERLSRRMPALRQEIATAFQQLLSPSSYGNDIVPSEQLT